MQVVDAGWESDGGAGGGGRQHCVAWDWTRPLAHRLVPWRPRAIASHRSLPGRCSPRGALDGPGTQVSAACALVASRESRPK